MFWDIGHKILLFGQQSNYMDSLLAVDLVPEENVASDPGDPGDPGPKLMVQLAMRVAINIYQLCRQTSVWLVSTYLLAWTFKSKYPSVSHATHVTHVFLAFLGYIWLCLCSQCSLNQGLRFVDDQKLVPSIRAMSRWQDPLSSMFFRSTSHREMSDSETSGETWRNDSP